LYILSDLRVYDSHTYLTGEARDQAGVVSI
jgi:hypothetical protein